MDLRTWATAILALVAANVVLPTPMAVADDSVSFTAELNGQAIGQSGDAEEVRIVPTRPVRLEVRVTNRGDRPVDVRTIRLTGRVIGLKFFEYETAVGIYVARRATATHAFVLDFGALDRQVTGLIPASMTLLDARRDALVAETLVVDVDGSLVSVYGIFGLTIALLTAVALGGTLFSLARHRLSPNRWRRALRFSWIGIGLALTLVFTFSAGGLVAPRLATWLPMVFASAGVLFVVGYFTPRPERPDGDLIDDLPRPDRVDT